MTSEQISGIALIDDELHLVLATGGRDSYMYIYREAQSVYWDPEHRSFKCATTIPGLPLEAVFPHMVRTIREFGITLSLRPNPHFVGLPESMIHDICAHIYQDEER